MNFVDLGRRVPQPGHYQKHAETFNPFANPPSAIKMRGFPGAFAGDSVLSVN
jgi:hypothetical protein